MCTFLLGSWIVGRGIGGREGWKEEWALGGKLGRMVGMSGWIAERIEGRDRG
jgi:hypothetical protein